MNKTQIHTELFRHGLTRINTAVLNINDFCHRAHRETQRLVFCFNSLLETVEAKNKLTRVNLCPSVSENKEFSVLSVFSVAKIHILTLWLVIILFLVSTAAAFDPNAVRNRQADMSRRKALQDGFIIYGLDGRISADGDLLYFAPFEPLTDGRGSLSAGDEVQILPSGMLEKLSAAITGKNKNFRIWGKFTNHKNTNFVFLSYFLPVAEVNEPPGEPDYADANEEKIIPDDVLALLRPKRIINLAGISKPLSTESDGIISDRTGFLKRQGQDYYFAFDALGRKIDSFSLPLLNCQALEDMIIQQDLTVERLRFTISAIVTVYKGKNYMLLQRAERAYDHGNFAR